MVVRRPTSGSIVRGPVEGDVLGPGGLPWDPGVGGGAAYDPSQEAGYLLDFFAEAGITEAGTGVSSWVDQASGVDVVQATDAQRPTHEATGLGGKPAVHFIAANSDGLEAASFANAATGYTVYIFSDPQSVAARRYFLDTETGRTIFFNAFTSGVNVGWRDGTNTVTAAATTGPQALTWSLPSGGGTGTLYRGNSSIATGDWVGNPFGGYLRVGGPSFSCDAKIGRLLVFNAVHDAPARSRVWAWGTAHYGGVL